MIREEKSVNISLLVRAWSSDNMLIVLIVVQTLNSTRIYLCTWRFCAKLHFSVCGWLFWVITLTLHFKAMVLIDAYVGVRTDAYVSGSC